MAKVKRVVITASVVSMMYSRSGTNNFSDKDWSDISDPKINAYAKSKTLAEKAAWDFVKNMPEGEKFELATIHPSLTFGPNFNTEFSTSVDIMTTVMLKKIPGVPKMCMGTVDVRNVAQAHLAAIKVPDAAGNRFLLVEGSYWFSEIGTIMHKNYGNNGYTVAYKEIPKFIMWIGSFFNKSAEASLSSWGIE